MHRDTSGLSTEPHRTARIPAATHPPALAMSNLEPATQFTAKRVRWADQAQGRDDEAEKSCDVHHDEVCPICKSKHEEGAARHKLSCGHEFYVTCILKWARSAHENHSECPTCGMRDDEHAEDQWNKRTRFLAPLEVEQARLHHVQAPSLSLSYTWGTGLASHTAIAEESDTADASCDDDDDEWWHASCGSGWGCSRERCEGRMPGEWEDPDAVDDRHAARHDKFVSLICPGGGGLNQVRRSAARRGLSPELEPPDRRLPICCLRCRGLSYLYIWATGECLLRSSRILETAGAVLKERNDAREIWGHPTERWERTVGTGYGELVSSDDDQEDEETDQDDNDEEEEEADEDDNDVDEEEEEGDEEDDDEEEDSDQEPLIVENECASSDDECARSASSKSSPLAFEPACRATSSPLLSRSNSPEVSIIKERSVEARNAEGFRNALVLE